MNESFKSNEYANARNKRNNSIQTMKICTFILAKLIASKLSTKMTDKTNETTSLPKRPLSSGFPITGLRNSPKIVLVKLKAKKNANTVTESPTRKAGLCSALSSTTVSTNIPLSKTK
jgi:hypothetical protein